MSWSTIAVELLEKILVFSKSPKDVGNACRTCKSWNSVDSDAHLWKGTAVDWKSKVVDLVLVRQNVQNGRCLVRTLATTMPAHNRSSLDIDNISTYKDTCLVNWMLTEDYGSYGGVTKENSDFINMVTEKVQSSTLEETVLLNRYAANSPSGYYGEATFRRVKILPFDPEEDLDDILFDDNNGLPLTLQDHDKRFIQNYCADSDYICFVEVIFAELSDTRKCVVFNAKTGELVYERTGVERSFVMYDNYLAISKPDNKLLLVDVITKKEQSRDFPIYVVMGFMTDKIIALRTERNIILWNYKDMTDEEYPAGQTPGKPIQMIYHNMWVVNVDAVLLFYDMKSGSLVNSLALRQYPVKSISQLSDGRLAVLQKIGCRVISFIDSEVNRKIKVEIIDHRGSVQSHEIIAYQLNSFFNEQIDNSGAMTSRVIKYSEREQQSDERFVMIFTSEAKGPINDTANTLLRTARYPYCVNIPYQAWKFDAKSVPFEEYRVEYVHGRAMIVREKMIDGRWQLVSM